jgi:KUP system potassium uptake protein
MGIVYGDIGTSPLYTWATILSDFEDHPYEEEDLIGAMCILVYSLILIVAIKYAIFILMADNRGEGGIFALTSLVPPTRKDIKTKMSKEIPRYEVWIKRICVALSIIGAGFIFGDGAITPAVSVLSAIEGTCLWWRCAVRACVCAFVLLLIRRKEADVALTTGLGVVNSDVPNYEVIIGLTILSILFLSQPFGSGQLAIFLGPIMLVWFMFIGGNTETVSMPITILSHLRVRVRHVP